MVSLPQKSLMVCGAPNTSSSAIFYFLPSCVGELLENSKTQFRNCKKCKIILTDIFSFKASMTCVQREPKPNDFISNDGEKMLLRRTSIAAGHSFYDKKILIENSVEALYRR